MLSDKKKGKFAAWLDKNPEGTFKQFYAEKLSRALSGEKRHSSIGRSPKKRGLHTTPKIFAKLVAKGLKPGDVFVDFGCGTLRMGSLLIEYLEPDRYVGFDIDQKILDVGRELLPAGLFDAKRPRLAVVSHESLRKAAELHPKWVFSKGVLQHVPPGELGQVGDDLRLGEGGLEGELPPEADALRDVAEELVDRGDPDRGQHGLAVCVGEWEEAHCSATSWR